MWVGLAIVAGTFILVVNRGVSPIPGKLQSVLEVILEFIRSMVFEFIGEEEGKKYVPFIATLFLFILACNLIGLVPGSYTITSQVVVTGAFAIGIFILTLVIGFSKHGMRFFGILVPPGVPKIMIPLMVPIEIVSMLARPLRVGRDEGQRDVRLVAGRELVLRALRRLANALERHRVSAQVDPLGVLEEIEEVVADAHVEVFATEIGVAVGATHLEDTV